MSRLSRIPDSGSGRYAPVHRGIYPCRMGFETIRLITFDCYGTLIDWENGMLAALRPLFSRDGRRVPDAQLLEVYGDIEAEIEAGPYLRYREVLAETARQMGRRLGITISDAEGKAFAESLARWKPFVDTIPALQSLAQKFRLGIISNVDDDLFAETRKKFAPVEFDFVVTAQQMQSYKPALRNFAEAVRRSGLSKDQILHAGQSLYHDVAPANALGIRNVWVNRPSIRPGSGAAKPGSAQPAYEVRTLAELSALVSAASA
ncbi:MAG TPA: haloacid dehalogenase type II [Candidatus Angelobacter sp.]|nr:haloacid dehalogenase type II [Candidatus Angelobacter sp.]